MEMIKNNKAAAGILGALALVGVGCWVWQLASGLGVTGMSNGVSWGLYITMFMFFVGLSAGGLIVASSASVFHIDRFKAVALPAVILSTVCICVAAAFVLVDLGGLQRAWRLLTGPNFTSPLIWDVCVIAVYLAINVLYLRFMSGKNADPRKVEIVSRFALPVAILVHSVTAWIFGLQIAREGWYTAILAPIFVASALDSGLALLLLTLIGLEKAKLATLGRDLMSSLAGLLAVCIAVDAFLVGCELLTVAYPGTAAGSAVLGEMLSGATAPFFWFEVVVGLVVPFCILVFAKNRRSTALVVGASACVVLGVLCKRVWLLFSSFVNLNIYGGGGVTLGTAAAQQGGYGMWALTGSYLPTIPEVAIVIGVVSAGALVFMALSSRISPSAAE